MTIRTEPAKPVKITTVGRQVDQEVAEPRYIERGIDHKYKYIHHYSSLFMFGVIFYKKLLLKLLSLLSLLFFIS